MKPPYLCCGAASQGVGDTYSALTQDQEAGQKPRLPDGDRGSIAQEPWSSVQPEHPRCPDCLFSVCQSASLPAGYATTLSELPNGPVYISRLCFLLEAYLLFLYFHFLSFHTTFWLFMSWIFYFPMKQGGTWIQIDVHKPVMWEPIFIKGDKLEGLLIF